MTAGHFLSIIDKLLVLVYIINVVGTNCPTTDNNHDTGWLSSIDDHDINHHKPESNITSLPYYRKVPGKTENYKRPFQGLLASSLITGHCRPPRSPHGGNHIGGLTSRRRSRLNCLQSTSAISTGRINTTRNYLICDVTILSRIK
jgi:hypothetical protein